jgi:polyisoprenoid-binding protein YceI
MHRLIYIVLILFFQLTAFSQTNKLAAKNWEVTSSTVKFTIKNAKLNVIGRFELLSAKILFDPSNLENSSIEGKVSLTTLNTGVPMRDKHLMKVEYFDTNTYPEISIKTLTISTISSESFIGKCIITIKGKSKEIEMPFTSSISENKRLFKALILVNRLDFGVGPPSILMSKNVEIELNVTTTSGKL